MRILFGFIFLLQAGYFMATDPKDIRSIWFLVAASYFFLMHEIRRTP